MTASERSKVLLDVASLIERDAELLAMLDTLECGKPIAQARGEIAGAADIWRYAAALARDLHGESFSTIGPHKLGVVVRDPIGVVSIITPWNFPFLIVSQKLPFALGRRLHGRGQAERADIRVDASSREAPPRGRPSGRRREHPLRQGSATSVPR